MNAGDAAPSKIFGTIRRVHPFLFQTTHQDITISGAGDYDGSNFKSRNTSITVSGVGNAVLAVSDNLEVNISGAGEVKYIGDPKVIQHVSGAGSITKK